MIDSRRVCFVVALAAFAFGPVDFASPLAGQAAAQDDSGATSRYSPEVVAKAEGILDGVSLRQAGKVIQSTATSDMARAISSLGRDKRELRQVYQAWKQVDQSIRAIRAEQERLVVQNGELNLQLARVAGRDVSANNRIVGLINANAAKGQLLQTQLQAQKDLLDEKRSELNKAESSFAETVLAIRSDYDKLKSELDQQLLDPAVQIALRVMHTNFETPEGLTADQILASVDKRIEKIEQQIFSESIPLEVKNNSMFVDVTVDRKSTRMVVDSGASIVVLPSKTAQELGVTVPSDARPLQLILADGRTIPARAVMLSRVRVGEFEAENVEAAVLDPSASDAEPLLGMSYLGNFKFTLDTAEKTLKLLRIQAE